MTGLLWYMRGLRGRLRRSLGNRGQSTLELALISPLVVGLFALTLQAGLVVSDQVQLEHFAYEGTQWAFAHRNDTGLTNADVANHVYQQMCGGTIPPAAPGAGATRFCQAPPAGIPAPLNVSVPGSATLPTASGWPSLWSDAEAAACKTWALSITPATRAVAAGNTASYTARLVSISGSGTNVKIRLTGGNFPDRTQGPVIFTPPVLSTSGATSATFSIATRTDATAATYNFFVSGSDDCSAGSQAHAAYANIVVGPPATSPTLPSPYTVTIDSVKSSALPLQVCVGESLTITGDNFTPQQTVAIGSSTATNVTFTNSHQITAYFRGLGSGTSGGTLPPVNVIDTGTGAVVGVMLNAVYVAPPESSLCPSADCTVGTTTYDNGGPGGVGRVIDTSATWNVNQWAGGYVTVNGQGATVASNTGTTLLLSAAWDTIPPASSGCHITDTHCVVDCTGGGFDGCASNCTSACTSNCSFPNCSSNCSYPLCTSNCETAKCTTACSLPQCTGYCNEHQCSATCSEANCRTSCDPGGCTASCTPPTACASDCNPPPTPDPCIAACTNSTCTVRCTTSCEADCTSSCVAQCSMPNCTSNCQESVAAASCLAQCSLPNCTSNCQQTSCLQGCTTPRCSAACNVPPAATGKICTSAGDELTVTITWYEPLVIPVITGSGQPYFKLVAQQKVTC